MMRTQQGGLAAVLGGLLWIGFHLWYITAGIIDPREVIRLIFIPALANAGFALALWALFRSERSGSGTRAGILVLLAGMATFIIGALAAFLGVGLAWLVAILGEMVISAGLAIFALANLGEKTLPRWNALPVVMLLLYVSSWMVDPGSVPALPAYWTEWLAVLYGLCWVALGMGVWSKGRRKPG